MKVFQLVMKDETNEKRKDDMRKTCETYTTDELLTTPLLGSHVRIHIQLCKFFQFFFFLNLVQEILIQFWPFSFGPGTSPTASTRAVHRFKGRKLFVNPSAGFSSPRQCVRDNCRLRYKCWQYFTRSYKCRTRRSKPSIFPILIAALASLNIVRPISPVVWSGIPKGSSGIPWIMVWSSMPNDSFLLQCQLWK